MCGIVGAATRREGQDILLEGLRRLEYRGYDSAGMAILADAGFRSYLAIAEAPTEKLAALDKISPTQAEKIQDAAAELIQ